MPTPYVTPSLISEVTWTVWLGTAGLLDEAAPDDPPELDAPVDGAPLEPAAEDEPEPLLPDGLPLELQAAVTRTRASRTRVLRRVFINPNSFVGMRS
jgi:hypothetical protein